MKDELRKVGRKAPGGKDEDAASAMYTTSKHGLAVPELAYSSYNSTNRKALRRRRLTWRGR